MIDSRIILAGMFIAGLFVASCGAPEVKKPEEKKPVTLETVQLDTMPFNCELDTMVQLGYIDPDWVYQNKSLGIRFLFPEGWNAVEDVKNNNPTLVPVNGDLADFRETYTHPHKLKLSLMKGSAWGEKRYLFGITKLEPRHPLDETPLDFSSAPLATAEVFYGEALPSEDALYKKVIEGVVSGWESENNLALMEANKASIKIVREQKIGNANFFSHTINIPTDNGIVAATTLVKKISCLFMVISFHWRNENCLMRCSAS